MKKTPWKQKRSKFQPELTENATRNPWKRRRTSGEASLIKGYSVFRPHQTQKSSLKSYSSMKKTPWKDKRNECQLELTEKATRNSWKRRRTSGDASLIKGYSVSRPHQTHNSSLECYSSKKKTSWKHNRGKDKLELTENITGIPSRKKRTSVINGYSVSPTHSIMLRLISKISSWQEKHGIMLTRMDESLVNLQEMTNRMRNNQYKFDGPIANLQICGDGRNQMNFKKEQPATKVDSPYPPLYQDLPIPLPTPVPACLPQLNPNKMGFLSEQMLVESWPPPPKLPGKFAVRAQPHTSGKSSTLVLARPDKHNADGSMLSHEVPALLTAMSPAKSPETEVLRRMASELKDEPPSGKSIGSAQAQPVACFQPALMPELPCKPHCTDLSTLSGPAPRPKIDAEEEANVNPAGSEVADEEEDCIEFDTSEKSSTGEIKQKAHLEEENGEESEGLYTPDSDTDFDSDSEYGSINDQINHVSDSEFNVSDIDEGGLVSGFQGMSDPFPKPALKKRKKKCFNSGQTNNLKSKVLYTENILTGFGPRVAATNQKGDFRIGLSGTREADDIELSVTDTGQTPDIQSGMPPAETGQASENQPVLSVADTASTGRAPDVKSGMSPAGTGQAGDVSPGVSVADRVQADGTDSGVSVADRVQADGTDSGVSVADRVQADGTDSGVRAKDTHQKGGSASCVSVAYTGQTDGSLPGANTGLTRLVGLDAQTDSGGEGIDSSMPANNTLQRGEKAQVVSADGTHLAHDVDCDSDVSAGDTSMKGSDKGKTDSTAISAIDTDPGGGRGSGDGISLTGDERSAVSASDTGQPLCIDSHSLCLQGSEFVVQVGDISSQKNTSAVDLSEFVTSQKETPKTAVPMSVRSQKGKTGADMPPSPSSARVVHTDEHMSLLTTFQKGNNGTESSVFAKIKLKNAGADVSAFGTSQKADSEANALQPADGLEMRSDSNIFCMSINNKGEIHFLEEGAEEKTVIWPTGIGKDTGSWDCSPGGEISLEGGVSRAEEVPGGTFFSSEEPHAIENGGGVPPETQTSKGMTDDCQFGVPVSTDVSFPTTAKVQDPGPTHGQSTVEVNPIFDSLLGLGSDTRQLPIVHSVGDLIFKCPTSIPF